MNKLYIDGNYIIAEDSRLTPTFIFNIKIAGSIYSVLSDPDSYTINNGTIIIPVVDIGDWFDEAGVTAFTEATLVDFLRSNTGV